MCRILVFLAVCFTVVAAFSGRLKKQLGDEGGLVDLINGNLYSGPSLTSWARQPRQTGRGTGNCRSVEWQCRDEFCIEKDAVCDGAVDCPDGSDETQAVCGARKACASHFYQCTYGACVEGSDKCNGVLDCADGSDERIKECDTNATKLSTNCRKHEFQCRQGQQCIDKSDVCDGVANCRDKSDETLYQCATNICPSLYEKCAYGACVDHGARCNNVVNCVDGSDEDPVLCSGVAGWRVHVPTTPTTNLGNRHDSVDPGSRGCVLPAYPIGGKYIIFNNPKLGPNQFVPIFTYLNYSCENGYDLSAAISPSCDGNNGWGETPTCNKKCRMPTSFSVDFVCRSAYIQFQCRDMVPHGTVVHSNCKREFEEIYGLDPITCQDGKWSKDPSTCKAICGRENHATTLFAKHAQKAKKNSFPWHVGVYQVVDGRPTYNCGGTILYPNVIISAAHCFYSDGLIDAQNFRIAAGKYYQSYDNPEDGSSVQKSNVAQIILPENYEGQVSSHQSDIALVQLSTPLEFGGFVRPICFDLDRRAKSLNDHQLRPGSEGRAGSCELAVAIASEAIPGQLELQPSNSIFQRTNYRSTQSTKRLKLEVGRSLDVALNKVTFNESNTVAGWGLTENGSTSEELRVLYMPIISNEICKKANDAFRSILTFDKVCAGYTNGSSVCQGDSGGGLVFKEHKQELDEDVWHLRALVSVGPSEVNADQCLSETYAAFTVIYQHREWMIEKFRSLGVLPKS